ncbi:phage repressor [Candidatus Omnitrophus magneticus]|uniref:Phage repressor n=1 Tax=Candidatus Omnitrophus magneticus TaxID=1609969 RepID=A0A0F0CV48_9BACT|nr:phage repressor [Candidatus Omnitrophus magneticus]
MRIVDPETQASFTVKKYRSEKEYLDDDQWCHKRIILSPENNDFKDIVLETVSAGDFRVAEVFLSVLD